VAVDRYGYRSKTMFYGLVRTDEFYLKIIIRFEVSFLTFTTTSVALSRTTITFDERKRVCSPPPFVENNNIIWPVGALHHNRLLFDVSIDRGRPDTYSVWLETQTLLWSETFVVRVDGGGGGGRHGIRYTPGQYSKWIDWQAARKWKSGGVYVQTTRCSYPFFHTHTNDPSPKRFS